MSELSGFRDNETGHARANVVTPPPTLVNLVTIGSLATHQILAKLATRILIYGDGGARAHVQRCPTPPMTCGTHLLNDLQSTYLPNLNAIVKSFLRYRPRLHESVGHNGKIRSANFRKKSDNRTRLHEQSAALNGIFR